MQAIQFKTGYLCLVDSDRDWSVFLGLGIQHVCFSTEDVQFLQELILVTEWGFNILRIHMTGCQWLMLVILAAQAAEIRRMAVWSKPGQIILETLSRNNPSQKWLVEWLKV
jgi:hypothetical protein